MDNKVLAVGAAGVAATAYCCLGRQEGDELQDVGAGESMGAGAGLKLTLVCSGAGSADDMAAAIPDDAVTFTILRQKFGAESHKFVFIQVCSALTPTAQIFPFVHSAGGMLGGRW